jgi:hypothetical protein
MTPHAGPSLQGTGMTTQSRLLLESSVCPDGAVKSRGTSGIPQIGADVARSSGSSGNHSEGGQRRRLERPAEDGERGLHEQVGTDRQWVIGVPQLA